MKDRIVAKGIAEERVAVLPPWSQDENVRYDAKGREAFRKQHNLEESFVVMYAGNHSPCHPLNTLVEAARSLSGRKEIVFCFVGGGSEQGKVREFATQHNLENIRCIPYQPFDALAATLSAADLHVIVMGNEFVGIVHPCKLYNILSVGVRSCISGRERATSARSRPWVTRAFARIPPPMATLPPLSGALNRKRDCNQTERKARRPQLRRLSPAIHCCLVW